MTRLTIMTIRPAIRAMRPRHLPNLAISPVRPADLFTMMVMSAWSR